MRKGFVFASFGLTLMSSALGQNLTSAGCVAPSAFETCYDTATANGATCITACAGYDLCVIACGCAMYEIQIGCLMESCWNKAYTCEYQKFAVAFTADCLTSSTGVPFWPPPDGAAQSCSCNLETLYDTVYSSELQDSTCLNAVTSSLGISNPSQAAKNDSGCACCAESGAVSAFYDICPDTDPSLIGLNSVMSTINSLTGGSNFAACDTTLGEFDCEVDLGFPALPSSGKYYANSNLPASGTQALSDVNGQLTNAPFGSVTTIKFSTTSYVLTASPYNSANAAATATTAGSGGSGATGTQTGAAAATSTKSAASAGTPPSWFVLIFASAALLTFV
ncbi:hypothetical protein BX600DRAFT_518211 [Xylariales sp. PMI_506]|nr:hypothetical protein BX600DRAFT_518211 [Xylariales sp. PMI_506]